MDRLTLDPETLKAVARKLAAAKRSATGRSARPAPKAKGPWKTVMAEHLEVAELATEPELETRGPYHDSTVTGCPARTLGAGQLEGQIPSPPDPSLTTDALYTRDTAPPERPDDRPEPDGSEAPPRPFVTPRRKRRRPRAWTGQALDAAGNPLPKRRG